MLSFVTYGVFLFLGTRPYDKLKKIRMKATIFNDIKLSPHAQTSSSEGFHATHVSLGLVLTAGVDYFYNLSPFLKFINHHFRQFIHFEPL